MLCFFVLSQIGDRLLYILPISSCAVVPQPIISTFIFPCSTSSHWFQTFPGCLARKLAPRSHTLALQQRGSGVLASALTMQPVLRRGESTLWRSTGVSPSCRRTAQVNDFAQSAGILGLPSPSILIDWYTYCKNYFAQSARTLGLHFPFKLHESFVHDLPSSEVQCQVYFFF